MRYTRYADDMTFSSNVDFYSDGSLMQDIEQIVRYCHFKINTNKTRLQANSGRQEVTGLIVNEKVNIFKQYICDIRSLLYIWDKYGYQEVSNYYLVHHAKHKNSKIENYLEGKLQYLKMIKGSYDSNYLAYKTKLDGLIMCQGGEDHPLEYILLQVERASFHPIGLCKIVAKHYFTGSLLSEKEWQYRPYRNIYLDVLKDSCSINAKETASKWSIGENNYELYEFIKGKLVVMSKEHYHILFCAIKYMGENPSSWPKCTFVTEDFLAKYISCSEGECKKHITTSCILHDSGKLNKSEWNYKVWELQNDTELLLSSFRVLNTNDNGLSSIQLITNYELPEKYLSPKQKNEKKLSLRLPIYSQRNVEVNDLERICDYYTKEFWPVFETIAYYISAYANLSYEDMVKPRLIYGSSKPPYIVSSYEYKTTSNSIDESSELSVFLLQIEGRWIINIPELQAYICDKNNFIFHKDIFFNVIQDYQDEIVYSCMRDIYYTINTMRKKCGDYVLSVRRNGIYNIYKCIDIKTVANDTIHLRFKDFCMNSSINGINPCLPFIIRQFLMGKSSIEIMTLFERIFTPGLPYYKYVYTVSDEIILQNPNMKQLVETFELEIDNNKPNNECPF